MVDEWSTMSLAEKITLIISYLLVFILIFKPLWE